MASELTDIELLAHAILGSGKKVNADFARKHTTIAENELLRRQKEKEAKEQLGQVKFNEPPSYL